MKMKYVIELYCPNLEDWTWVGTLSSPSETWNTIVFWQKAGWKSRYRRVRPEEAWP